MNISKHDKNLVQLIMITEIFAKSLVSELDRLQSTAPIDKQAQYAELLTIISPLHSQMVTLNDQIADDVHKCMSDDEQDLLVDSALSMCLLLETQSPKQINKALKLAGIKTAEVVNAYLEKSS